MKQYRYDAFISYSRVDDTFAEKLERALEKFKPPQKLEAPLQYLNIFRFVGDWTGNEYYPSVQKHIEESAKLIVICTPNARKSPYVNDEIDRFTQVNSTENIIPILLNGTPDNLIKPVQEKDKAFPDALCKAMESPIYIDYRGFISRRDRINKGVFKNSWYTILANLYEMPREVIEERDRKKQIRRRRISIGLISSIILILSILSTYALVQRANAIRQLSDANYNLALVFKELAKNCIKDNKWQLTKLYAVQSLLYQNKAKRYFPLDIGLPLVDFEWNLKFKNILKHNGAINVVLFSYDGNYIFSGGNDNKIKKWDLKNGRELFRLVGHTKRITALDIHPTQRFLLSSSEDKSLIIWDIAKKPEKLIFNQVEAHENYITCAKFSPNGKYIVSAGTDGIIKRWKFSEDGKIESPNILKEKINKDYEQIKGENEIIRSICFHPDGKILASGSDDGKVRLWDIDTAKQIRLYSGHNSVVRTVSFSPNGKYLTSGGWDNTIIFWDLKSENMIRSFIGHNDKINTLVFSLDSKYLISAGSDKTIKIWNIIDIKNVVPREILSLTGPKDLIVSVDFFSNFNKEYIACSGNENYIFFWELLQKKEIVEFKTLNAIVNAMAFSPDEKFITLAIDGETNNLSIRNTIDGNQLRSFGVNSTKGIKSLNYSPNGCDLIILYKNKSVQVLSNFAQCDAHKKIEFKSIFRGNEVDAIHISSNCNYIVSISKGKITIWDVLKERFVHVFYAFDGSEISANISDDGQFLAIGSLKNSDIKLLRFNDKEFKKIKILKGNEVPMGEIIFAPNGRYLASRSLDNQAFLWNIHSGNDNLKPIDSTENVSSIAFDYLGNNFLSLTVDHRLRIFDTINKNEIALIEGNDCLINIIKTGFGRKKLIAFTSLVNNNSIISIFKINELPYFPWMKLFNPYSMNELEELMNKMKIGTIFYSEEKTNSSIESLRLFRIGENYINNEDFNRAIILYENAIKIDNKNFMAYLSLGKLYLIKKDYKKAIKLFDHALKIDPDCLEAKNELSNLYRLLIDSIEWRKYVDSVSKLNQKLLEILKHMIFRQQ